MQVGDQGWLLVGGAPEAGASCHQVSVVTSDATGLGVQRPAWTDPNSRGATAVSLLLLSLACFDALLPHCSVASLHIPHAALLPAFP